MRIWRICIPNSLRTVQAFDILFINIEIKFIDFLSIIYVRMNGNLFKIYHHKNVYSNG